MRNTEGKKSFAGQVDTICHLLLKTYGLCRPEATEDNIIVSLEGDLIGYQGHSSSPF